MIKILITMFLFATVTFADEPALPDMSQFQMLRLLTTDVHWIRLHGLSSPALPTQPTDKQDQLPDMSQFEMLRTLTIDVHWIRLYLEKHPPK